MDGEVGRGWVASPGRHEHQRGQIPPDAGAEPCGDMRVRAGAEVEREREERGVTKRMNVKAWERWPRNA